MDQDYLMNYFRFTIFKKRLSFLFCILFFGNYISVRAQNCTVNAGIITETICATDAMTLQGAPVSPIIGTVSWKQVSGPAVIITSPNTPVTTVTGYVGGSTYVFRYSATCGDGVTTYQDKTVIVEPITIANAGSNIASCPNSSGTVQVTGNTPQNSGEIGHWEISGANNAGIVINTPNSPTTTLTLPTTSCGITTLSWIIEGPEYSAGLRCSSTSSITVTNYGGVTPISAGADITLSNCYTSTQSVNMNGSFGGCNLNGQNGTWSFVTGPTTPTIASPNSNTTNVSNLQQGTYVLRWTVTGPCASGSDDVSIIVPAATQDVTTLTGGTENIAFCDNTVTQVTLEGQAPLYAGEIVTWTQTGGRVLPAGSIQTPNNPTTLITGISDVGDPFTFHYTISNNITGCSSSKDYIVRYRATDRTIVANNGNDVFGACGQTQFSIPITTTGTGGNKYRILSGPAASPLGPFPTTAAVLGVSLNVTLTVPGNYIFQFVRSENGDIPIGCDYGFDDLTVVVSALATPSNAGSDVNLNCGVTVAPLSGVGLVGPGDSYWTQISGPNTATIVDRNAQNTTATGLISGAYEFQYITKGGGTGCPLSTDNVIVNVSSSSHSLVEAGPNQTTCVNSVVTLSGSTPAAGEKGTWSLDPGNVDVLVIADPSDPNTTVTGFTTSGSVNRLYWTIDYINPGASGCAIPVQDFVDITIDNGTALVTAQAGPDACYPASQTTISLAGNNPLLNGQGAWTVSPTTGAFIVNVNSPTSAVTISNPGTYTFTWTITPLTCGVTSDDVVITIADNATVADAGPDQDLCGNEATMAATLPSGATGLWTRTSGLENYTISDPTDPNAVFTFTSSGPYVFRWTITAGSCASTAAFDEVRIRIGLPPAAATAGPDQTICTTTTQLVGSSYNTFFELGKWIVLAGAPNIPTIADATNPLTNVSDLVQGTYVFRWQVQSKGNFLCPGASFDDVTINVSAPAYAGTDQTLCNVTSVQLIGTVNSTGTWTCTAASPGNIADVVITQTPLNSYVANATVIPGNTYEFTYTINGAGSCPLSSDTVNVTVNAGASAPPNAGPDQTICNSDVTAVTLAGSLIPSGVTAQWQWVSRPSGSVAVITAVNDPTSTVTNLTVSGLYILKWTFSSASCSDLSDIVRINVFQAPSTANAGPDDTVACQQSFTTNAIAPTAGIGTWTFASQPVGGAAVIDNPNNPKTTLSNVTVLGTYVLSWTVTNGPFTSPSLCAPSVDQVSVTFNANPPSIANAGPDQELCAVTQTTLAATAVTPGKGTWTQTSGAAATIVSINDPATLITGLTTGEYDFTWTATTLNADGCSSADTVHIKIFAQPISTDAGPDQTKPQFTQIVMAATAPTIGVGHWVRVSGASAAVTFANATSPTTAIAGLEVGTTTFDWQISNGPCSVAHDLVTITVVANTDLELTKLVSPANANVGDEVTFTINVFNHDTSGGTVTATGVVVKDIIPNGYTLIPGTISNGGAFNIGDKSITWSNLTIPLNTTTSLTFHANVTNAGSYLNSAEIIACDQFDIDSTPNNNIVTEDDEGTAGIAIQYSDLSVQKTVTPTVVSIGENVVFTVVVTNSGPDDAINIFVKDQLPAGYTYVSHINNPLGGVYTPTTGEWEIGDLNVGDIATLDITATVNAISSTNGYINTVEVINVNQFDPDSTPNNNNPAEDDQASANITLQNADLELNKTVSPTSTTAGGVVTFTLALTNNGPGNATGVAVTDYLPDGFSLVPGSVSNGGTYQIANSTLLWQNLSLASGGNLNLTFRAIANATGNHINTAQITDSDLPDPDSTPNNNVATEDDQSQAEVIIIPDTVDLILTKNVVNNNITPLIGSQITFQVTVANSTAINATGVQVRDIIPAGYEYVLFSSTSGNYDETTGFWNVPNVDAGTSEILLLTVKVITALNPAVDYLNIAEIMTCDQPDVDSTPGNGVTTEDDYATAVTTPVLGFADLSLTKTIVGGNTSPGIGSKISFEIIITNNGPQDATGVQVTDLLPSGYTFNIATTSVGTYNSTTGLWNLGGLANGASESLTVNATVNATGGYENIAQVTASNLPDPNSTPGNNVPTEDDYASVTTTPVTGSADLSLTKIIVGGNVSPLIGSRVSFEVTVSNNGPQNPTGVQVRDLLPSGFTYFISTATAGNYVPTTGIWTIGSLITGDSETLTILADVNAAGDYENIAEITASSLQDPDSTPANGIATEDDYASVTVTPTVGSADLSLTKTIVGGDLSPLIGSVVSFEIIVTNNGPQDVSGVQVIDLLPTGYTYNVSTPSAGTYNSGTGEWNVGVLPNGQSETLTVNATVNPAGVYINTAEVTASSLPDPDSTPNNAPAAEDDYAILTITPVSGLADLSLTKTIVGGNTSPLVGATVSFEIVVTNNGPQNVTGVQVTDLLPTGYTYSLSTPSAGTYTSSTGVWNVGALTNGQSETLLINAVVNPTGPYNNVAEVTASSLPDPNSTPNNQVVTENDYASVIVTPINIAADLSLTKTIAGGNATPFVGAQITFNVVVNNAGPQNAAGVVVADLLPTGYTFVSSTVTTGTYNNSTGTWTVGSFISGATETLTVTATVNPTGIYTNIAEIKASSLADPDSTPNNGIITEDDYAAVIVTPITAVADLSLTKNIIGGNASPFIGSTISFEIVVNNNGPQNVSGVQVRDVLPTGYTYTFSTPSAGTYNAGTGIWNLGLLPNGASESLVVNATVNATGIYINNVEITASSLPDPDSTPNNGVNSEDDYASVVVTPVMPQADLSLTKTITGGNTSPLIGATVAFNVVVNNAGPQNVAGVTVTDLLPAGYTFVSSNVTTGTYNSTTGLWTVGALISGASETLVVNAIVNATGNYTNIAEVTASNLPDPDSTPNNAVASEDDYASVTLTPITSSADLSLTKVIVGGNTSPLIGAGVSFEIVVTNNGPQDVTGVQITDLLPSGYTYSLSTPSAGTYISGTGVWTVGSLINGQSETLLINAVVNATGTYTNVAEVTASSLPDPNSIPNNQVATENDYASVIVTPVSGTADLSLTKTITGGNTSPLVGATVAFNVVVNNAGPQNAAGIAVTDLLPAGYTFVSSNVTTGTYNNVTGLWTVGALISGASETLVVNAVVNATGNYTNIAEVTASNLPDPDSTPNNAVAAEDDYASVTLTPITSSADLSLTKVIVGGNTSPLIGAGVSFEIVVTNNGPQDVTGVQITDLLPSGYTYSLSTPSAGTYISGTGVWTVGSLINGQSETLLINAVVNATGTYTNVAEVTASSLPDPNSTPNNQVATENDYASVVVTPVGVAADLSLTKTIVGGNTTPLAGAPISFEIVVTNNGPQDTAGVLVKDLLTAGFSYVSATPSSGTYNATTGIWNVGVLPNGQSETLVINATVNPILGNHTNIAEITASSLPDPDSTPNNGITTEDDYASVTVVPVMRSADLVLTKFVVGGNNSPAFGTTITFQVNVFNRGPQDATNVKVIDILPSGYEYVVFSSTAGVYNELTGIWNIGTIANGSSETLLMTVTVNPTGNYLNIAEIFSSDLPDPNSTPNNGVGSEDDIGSVPLAPVAQISDLSISKLVVNDNLTPLVGSQITFQITLTNSGPNIATNVEVKDLLPPGYVYVFYNSSSGSYNSLTGIWSPGIVLPNSSQTLLMNVLVKSPTGTPNEYLNTAEVTKTDQFDPDSTPNNGIVTEDDYDSIAVTPVIIMADLSLEKTIIANPKPNVGDIVSFQVKVSNAGPGNATGVEVTDLLPSGFTYLTHSTTSGNYSFADGKWNLGVIANGSDQTLLVYGRVKPVTGAANEYLNTAEITASTLQDPDSTPNNGVITEDDYDSVNVEVQASNLSLIKSVSNVKANVNEVVTFTVQINNAGPAVATGVNIEDLLPIGYSNITNISNGGIYSGFRLTWSKLQIPLTGLTLTYQATIDSPVGLKDSDYVNTVQVTASDQFDPNSTPDNDDGDQSEDDEDKAAIEIPKTDIAIIKTVDATDPVIDATINFTITADNIGNLKATNVEIQDILPTGYQFVSATASSGTYNASTGIWQVPSIDVNAIQTLTLTVKVKDVKDYLNTAKLLSLDQIDTNAANNESSATIEPTCLKIINEFSPNDDGINDVFYIDCIVNYPDNTLEIYNRWGKLVYSQRGYKNTWGGTSETEGAIKVLPVGTYFYILNLGDGTPKTSGWLYLKR